MFTLIYWLMITVFYFSSIQYYKTPKPIYAYITSVAFIGTWVSLFSLTTTITPLIVLVYSALLFVQYKFIIRT